MKHCVTQLPLFIIEVQKKRKNSKGFHGKFFFSTKEQNPIIRGLSKDLWWKIMSSGLELDEEIKYKLRNLKIFKTSAYYEGKIKSLNINNNKF